MSQRYIAWLDGEWRVRDLEEDRYIATVWSGKRRGHEQGVAEHIARALNCYGDLLAACEGVLHNLSQGALCPEDLDTLRAIIAKAKGVTP